MPQLNVAFVNPLYFSLRYRAVAAECSQLCYDVKAHQYASISIPRRGNKSMRARAEKDVQKFEFIWHYQTISHFVFYCTRTFYH